jgi:hypothetical protein
MFPGVACNFCQKGNGCSIYADRPQDPCVAYQCAYILDNSVPEWMKPSISNVIISIKHQDNIKWAELTPAAEDYSHVILSWFIIWGISNYSNILWLDKFQQRRYIGSTEFIEIMDKQNGF